MATSKRTIARYTDAELIGQGGFGSVYRAIDAEHGRVVAIKVLMGTLGETERRRFDRERQTMGLLGAHPNIVPIHESGYTEQGEGYLVMEFANGGSLRDRLESETRIPWAEAVSIMGPIAAATQVAHDHGVLHRDIKPDNILIDQFANPKLTDFGIAAVASNATATTSTTATLAHAAPEILQGQAATEAVDIYAIGSTLYNLITGFPPFLRPGDEGVTPMITRALTAPPPDLRHYGVPDAVAVVAEQALAKAPEARQATAGQLSTELVAALGNGVPRSSDPRSNPRPVPTPESVPTINITAPYGQPAAQTVAAASQQVHPQWGHTGPAPAMVSDSRNRSDRTGNDSGRSKSLIVAAIGLVGALCIALGAVVVVNRETGQSPEQTTSPTAVAPSTSTTATSDTKRETATTIPEPDSPPEEEIFEGFSAEIVIFWERNVGDTYAASVLVDGATGIMIVDAPDPDTGLLIEVHQDLTLAADDNGDWAYIGSNPTLLDGSPLINYDPDILLLTEVDGEWIIDQVCDSDGCYLAE